MSFIHLLAGAREEPAVCQLGSNHPKGGDTRTLNACLKAVQFCTAQQDPKWGLIQAAQAAGVGSASSHPLTMLGVPQLGPALSLSLSAALGGFWAALGCFQQPHAAAPLLLCGLLQSCHLALSPLAAESRSSSPWASRPAATWRPWRMPSATWLTRGTPPTRTWGWTDPHPSPQPHGAGQPLPALPPELVLHQRLVLGQDSPYGIWIQPGPLTVHHKAHLLPPSQLHHTSPSRGLHGLAPLRSLLSAPVRIPHSKLLPGLSSRTFCFKMQDVWEERARGGGGSVSQH